ncbi:MAG: cytochrome b/b6 domain-containing protein [Candidatus Omnitrophota bacterium]|nr:cytochrome b/b6 domain-containing protein [Candidatus Omnitrophota bacterium]
MRIYKPRSICIGIFLLMALSFFPAAHAIDTSAELSIDPDRSQRIENSECLTCHDDIKPDVYNASVHGKNLCTSCHADITEAPHPEKPGKPVCNQCHRIEAEIYNSSDHGVALKAGIDEAASCRNCHGQPHGILDSRNKESPVYRANIPETCAVCHEDQAKMEKYALTEKTPLKSYSETVHGKALVEKGLISSAICTDCHGSHDLYSMANAKSKIYHSNVPSTCGKCHENVSQIYERSVHGKAVTAGRREAPVCTDCHGEHTIKARSEPTSSVYPTAISSTTCPRCHASENIISKYRLPGNMVKTYMESYHGLASKSGSTIVANCASCHGVHDILPSSDPDSSVNKANLPQTCGKCHPGAGAKLTKGSVHINPSATRDRAVFYVTLFYILLIVMTIGGMIIYVGLDYLTRLREHYARVRAAAVISRWTFSERLQHFILLITFTVLAYTGFALRFSEAWWAFPFTVIKDGSDWRRILHRGTAIVFCLLSAYHAWFLLLTKRGRSEFKAFLPGIKDFVDLYKMLKHNLGISKEKPKFERFNFVEKYEYWALIWGSLIMIMTGVMLIFNTFVMKHFPKWILDVAATIHFYEALLATLAILVWHLYFSIFSPEHYPMNWSWITGRTTEDERRENDISDDHDKR